MDLIRLKTAQKMCIVDWRTLKDWAREDKVELHRSPQGLSISRKDLRACLLRRDLPIPEELEQRPRILIVDDDADLLKVAAWSLNGVWPDASIRTARDGDQAARILMEWPPELLVTDLRMPGYDGMMLSQMVRENRELSRTKVLAFTGYDDPETRWEIFQCGAHEYLVKPFEPADLRQSAVRLIGAGSYSA